ncbi:MAG: hypothetical protein L0387_07605 [Acidobacteria bacterium]|nr:hypothetical protein [Acidobacteriota bacterium]MCI0723914.1 hypothetical protein [Acidobacteriota bacterium]
MEPWKTDRWWVSPLNFSPEVWDPFEPPPSVEFYDVTLREADECAGAILQVEDKVQIARALNAAGVQRIEVGLITPNSYNALEAILKAGFEHKVYAAGKLIDPDKLERAIGCGVRRITVGIRTSDLFIETILGKTRAGLLESARSTVGLAKDRGLYVNLFLADAPRSDLEFLEAIVREATTQWGVDAVTVVDTLGFTHPQAFGYLIGKARQWCRVPVEAHCHNDFGLGTATAISGYLAGASVLHVSVNGVGYRAGNPALEEVAASLQVLYGVDTGVRLESLSELSRLVADRSGLALAYNKPLVGLGAFAYEQWGDLRKWQASGLGPAGMPIDPAVVGNSPQFVLSKWSDPAMLDRKLSELGLEADGPTREILLRRAKEFVYAHQRPVENTDLGQLYESLTRKH